MDNLPHIATMATSTPLILQGLEEMHSLTRPTSSNKVTTVLTRTLYFIYLSVDSRALSQHSLQAGPFTPLASRQQSEQCWTTPSTEDLRLDFTCENNTILYCLQLYTYNVWTLLSQLLIDDDPTAVSGKSTIGLRSVTEIRILAT